MFVDVMDGHVMDEDVMDEYVDSLGLYYHTSRIRDIVDIVLIFRDGEK